MIRISQLKLPVGHSEAQLEKKISRLLKCPGTPFTYTIQKQSLDSRHKNDKKFVYTVDVEIRGEEKILKKVGNNNITLTKKKPYLFPEAGTEPLAHPPVIIGSGPAGLFCAWYLARAGYQPIVLERGEEAERRLLTVEKFWKDGVLDPDSNVQFGEGGWYLARAGYQPIVLERGEEAERRLLTVEKFWKDGVLDPDSNVQFGEGGAGTFSDGKLNTLVERGEEAERRLLTVEKFWKDGVLDPDSNVQFGEGGAGTFSDGKLNTLVKDPFGRNHEVLYRFVQAGAPAEILYQQKPHLGTDVLIGIVQEMRKEIEEMGGSFRFRERN